MFQPMPEITQQLAKLHTQQLLREADADRLAREARRGMPHPAGHLLAHARAALAALVRLGQQRTSSPVKPAKPAQTTGTGVGLPAATPAAR
jgi:hypothetical protein